MSSERRLHPYSIGFAFLTQIRLFIVPGLLVYLGAQRNQGDWWQPWMMLFVVPNAAFAVFRYFTYRYRYDDNELVIRSGLLFRRERHIPYARIQNIDAVQQVLHRLLNVVDVRIETGGGATAEATMSVLPLSALAEMRERVFAERHALSTAPPEQAPPQPIATAPPLLHLDTRELILCGFIENRGAVLIAAAFGLIWELGLFDRIVTALVGEQVTSRGVLRNFARSVISNATISWERLALTVVAFIGVLLLIRLFSMAWAVVRLHDYTLTVVDADARSQFGLLTRVAQTIPLGRIQALSVREGPLHRYFRRVAVRVNTAGGRLE
jgi:putative membrane protein